MPDGAMTDPLPKDINAGLFGKLPARGDFVRENLPRDFTDAWDGWWQRGLADTQRMAGDAWRDAWLEAPVWRFILPPGLCGRRGVIGLWMPSVDKAGRFFPLTIAATAATDWAEHAMEMAPFLDIAENAGRDALEFDLAPGTLLERITAALSATEPAQDPPPDCIPGQCTWWTQGGPRVVPRADAGMALPEGSGFATMISDSWGMSDNRGIEDNREPVSPAATPEPS